ncbi:hypothetical protein T552_01843 [Pneumocystis carinii B80]|uniref:Casein kinase II subunit beta n=1 Tax=Pneumocystis carinii (strain B80) TaxID=1408658 RepID=A0A0W4ZJP2_PNEC8|nr:hypothetical protein T552_01843 [Pneumocystis carinii B80]KTW28582.1 hypothetical protein T552_01843 [Pneumocystis carinii B80]
MDNHLVEGSEESNFDTPEVNAFYEDSLSTNDSEAMTWISWWCSHVGHDYFAEVSEEFIEDNFNLTGLNTLIPFYKEALEMILDVDSENTDEHMRAPDQNIIESSAELLYGLIHQRYIVSRAGLHAMAEKFEMGHFGHCPRVYCNSTSVVPCGRSDLPGLETVKLFCPNCLDIYVPPNSRFQNIDGAFFGTTFPHLFFQTYPEYKPSISRKSFNIYQPKIYGFKISERSKSGPRMSWLRKFLGKVDSEKENLLDEKNDNEEKDKNDNEYL